jgi:predicted O-methyltransferase YrrM
MNSSNASPADAAPAAAGLPATLAYQLRCIRLMLGSHPPPGMLRRYVTYYAKRMLAADKASTQAVDDARRLFGDAVAGRQFTGNWFDNNIPVWVDHLAALKARVARPDILEIGSYEGRSTLFLLAYFPAGRVTVVDLWGDATEHHAVAQLAPAEGRFDSNIREFGDRVTKLRGRSAQRLAMLLSNGTSQFDLIYIDGSHYSDDVMLDAVLSWSLLRKGGVMIFDDYMWLDYHYGPAKSVCRAANLFLRLVEGEYRLRHVAHQLIIEKTRSPREIRPHR